MSTALDGVRAKIGRAEDHLKDIDASIEHVLGPKQDPHGAGHEYDDDRQELIVTLPKVPPLDPTLPLMVGDCIHNARSALDHLVFQLAVMNHASDEAASKTSFPVYLTSGEFQNAVKTKIAPFISSAALAEIKKLQPYATGNAGKDDIIWVLSQLDIIDKHRLLIVAVSKFRPVDFCVTVPTGEQFSHKITSGKWKASKDRAEVIRFDLSGAIKRPGKVNVKVGMTTTVQIEDTGLICDGMIVGAVLADCIQYVTNIVDGFGQVFFGE